MKRFVVRMTSNELFGVCAENGTLDQSGAYFMSKTEDGYEIVLACPPHAVLFFYELRKSETWPSTLDMIFCKAKHFYMEKAK